MLSVALCGSSGVWEWGGQRRGDCSGSLGNKFFSLSLSPAVVSPPPAAAAARQRAAYLLTRAVSDHDGSSFVASEAVRLLMSRAKLQVYYNYAVELSEHIQPCNVGTASEQAARVVL